jgi:hypothetical protein
MNTPLEGESELPEVTVVVWTTVEVFTWVDAVVFVTVASREAYDRTLADITTAAMTIAMARRAKLLLLL